MSDWSSDVCSSDLDYPAGAGGGARHLAATADRAGRAEADPRRRRPGDGAADRADRDGGDAGRHDAARWDAARCRAAADYRGRGRRLRRSEEHTSELQSLMRTSYAVFCLKKKKKIYNIAKARRKRYAATKTIYE